MPPRRQFQRKLGDRRYRKMFVIATEGAKTEPQYFSIFQHTPNTVVKIKCLPGNTQSSPQRVLARMNKFLQEKGLRKEDEAWLVVDKDSWTEQQLNELYFWSQSRGNYGLAVSNPQFEIWLLFHFEAGKGVTSAHRCLDMLKRYLPGYKKGSKLDRITMEQVSSAIYRAKQRDNPPCSDWPRSTGTTVYRLVEKLLCS